MKLLEWLNDQSRPEFAPEASEPTPSAELKSRLDELKKTPVQKIMVSRPLIQALDADVQLRRVRRLKSSKVRHYPVYRGDLNRILGWIEKYKVLELLQREGDDARLETHLNPVTTVSETSSLLDVFEIFLKRATPILIVQNSAGQTVGLITLQSFVSEFFGVSLDEVAPMSPSSHNLATHEL